VAREDATQERLMHYMTMDKEAKAS
jgi:hypothetical protein